MSSKNSKQLAAKWKLQFQSGTFRDVPGHCQLRLLLAELGACSDILRSQWAQDPQGWGGLLRQHPQSSVCKPRKGEKLHFQTPWRKWTIELNKWPNETALKMYSQKGKVLSWGPQMQTLFLERLLWYPLESWNQWVILGQGEKSKEKIKNKSVLDFGKHDLFVIAEEAYTKWCR